MIEPIVKNLDNGTFEMREDIKAQWLVDLRSGDYEQAKEVLFDDTHGICSYCCLGVLGKILGLTEHEMVRTGLLSDCPTNNVPLDETGVDNCYFTVIMPISTTINKATNLAALNDGGYTFAQIADVIERYVPSFPVEKAT